MADPWVLVAPGEVPAVGGVVRLEGEEGRHLARVLRRGVGSPVVLCDGRGRVGEARISSVHRDRVEVEVIAVATVPPPSAPAVDVALAVLHTAAMDWAVQKAVEVGVRRLHPVIAERSQLAASAARRRVAHWRRAARQALKQCRRAWEMEVADPVGLADLLGDPEIAGGLVVADPEGAPPGGAGRAGDVTLLVGPEGGFSEREFELLERGGFPRARLGDHVLRAETAAVVGAALLRASLGPGGG